MRIRPEAFEFFRREFGVPNTRIFAAVFGVWSFLALLSSAETYLMLDLRGSHIPIWRAVIHSGWGWLLYGAMTPLILQLGDTWPIRGRTWAWRTMLHLAFALAIGLTYAAGTAATWQLSGIEMIDLGGFWPMAFTWYLSCLPLVILAYFLVHGLGRAVYWFARNRTAEVLAERLRGEASEARLAALQTQVHPHFLFNALNAIDALIHDGETDAAGEMLHQLSDVLRESLDGERPPEVSLGSEIALVRKYLGIQAMRFPDRLRVSFEIPPELERAFVPSFALQPLVENALRHGIGPRRDAGRLAVRAAHAGDLLTLTVDDDGKGPAPDARRGLGLGNLASRLHLMYGEVAGVELRPNAWGGASATVVLPLRMSGADG